MLMNDMTRHEFGEIKKQMQLDCDKRANATGCNGTSTSTSTGMLTHAVAALTAASMIHRYQFVDSILSLTLIDTDFTVETRRG
ncbi:unnamed protein product [Ceratitis capitata]|uniref:(Mediterranean fruit fly) hypothetical protein n=1 Tax=Ceratitis capitata TaxID=7213 RepID=A0A811UD34_CERCA|nr:unnamed protein product [Ceratitis capitata]